VAGGVERELALGDDLTDPPAGRRGLPDHDVVGGDGEPEHAVRLARRGPGHWAR